MSAWLKVEKLDFRYDREVLNEFSLTVEKRGLFRCAGPSGVGKSTLALLLSGHLTPSAGRIELAGQAIRGPSRKSLLVSQEDDLFPWLRMREQLDFFSSLPGSWNEYDSWIPKLRLQDYWDNYPHELSGGTRKRLALLRSTILKPELLILDETLAGVEPELRENILRDFSSLWDSLGVGVMIIAHDHSPTMERIAPTAVILSARAVAK